jgi:DNA-binding transcriptional MerR regulator
VRIDTLTARTNAWLDQLGLLQEGPLTVRVVRDYVHRGLVSRPTRRGKGAYYGERQMLELVAARVLIRDGWPLGKIADYLPRCEVRALGRLIPEAPADRRQAGEVPESESESESEPGAEALALIQRFRGGQSRARGSEPVESAPAPSGPAPSAPSSPGSDASGMVSPAEHAAAGESESAQLEGDVSTDAAALAHHRAALAGVRRQLGAPSTEAPPRSLVRLTLTPWCTVDIDPDRLSRLSVAEAEALGRALTAALLQPPTDATDPTDGGAP